MGACDMDPLQWDVSLTTHRGTYNGVGEERDIVALCPFVSNTTCSMMGPVFLLNKTVFLN